MTIIETTATAPTPLDVPRARPVPLPTFDLISEISPHGVAWAGRNAATGEEVLRVNARERGDDVLGALTDRVTRWIDTQSKDVRQVKLRCFSLALRDSATSSLDPERYVIADPIELNGTRDWADTTRVLLRERLGERDQQVFLRSTLYAASDGSVHPHYGNGAYSWVTHEGDWSVQRASDRIISAELSGIISFAKHFHAAGTHYRAVLFTDSLAATDILASWRVGGDPRHNDPAGLELVREMVAARRLELIWVRSHNGHLLNDVADRLALLRHRAVRMELTSAQVKLAGDRIVAEAMPALEQADWAQQTRVARQAFREHLRGQQPAA